MKQVKRHQPRLFAVCAKTAFSLPTVNRMSYGESKRSWRVSLGPWWDLMSTSLRRSHRASLRTTMMLRYNTRHTSPLISRWFITYFNFQVTQVMTTHDNFPWISSFSINLHTSPTNNHVILISLEQHFSPNVYCFTTEADCCHPRK